MSEHLSSMSEDLGSNPHFPIPLEKGQKKIILAQMKVGVLKKRLPHYRALQG